jgi:hypothetical protein
VRTTGVFASTNFNPGWASTNINPGWQGTRLTGGGRYAYGMSNGQDILYDTWNGGYYNRVR